MITPIMLSKEWHYCICYDIFDDLASQICSHWPQSVSFVATRSPKMHCPLHYNQASYAKTLSWKKDIDCCQWDGVTCDPIAGHVIGLDLSCSQLTGPITSNNSIFLLNRLRSLNLGFNNFSSNIPQELGQLSHLEYLNLSNSGFFGHAPSEMAQLSQLRSIDLSDAYYIVMPNLGEIIANLTELRELNLYGVDINSTIPQSLMNLSSLTSLQLSFCSLYGKFPDDILQLPHLRVLNIMFNELLYANFTRSSNWSSPLEVLHLRDFSFSGRLPDSLSHSESLRDFSIASCNFHGMIPSWVWNITELTDLSGNNFNGELPSTVNIGSLSTLTGIYLDSNLLSGMLPSWLFNLPLLQVLFLEVNQFSGELNHINNNNNSLDTIILGFNKIYGPIPKAIFGLTSLIDLSLRSNKLSGSVELNRISNLKRLRYLDLSANSLSVTTTNEDANFTISWPQLYTLRLSFCNITEFPNFLRSQKDLFILDLSNNNIHGEAPKWLHDMESITYLQLSQNSLTGGLEDL
ncbi:hypothetical protein Nepgr_007637 [Nepenthes gracilis]|uniref:Leucine-rich repeat-containing N-terminal plant-type domain-containing protein n=1 Tax=Nepenthes gracilis TaxID=150966 RepID=A0AAD3S783_NEPGR|nr:hypothetical protein Nepgr_007637 [Nepenthes gracilis]